ncbi:MAG: hypothetical protein HLX50_16630 [Alteromonadaceae bacterium]|nr:hypothetical protein [Alteromonadaceae bacterium]
MTDDLAAFIAACSSLATSPELHRYRTEEWKSNIEKVSFYKARVALRLNPLREVDADINSTANALANMLANPDKHFNLPKKSLDLINQFPDQLARWKAVTWSDGRANF